MEAVQKGTNPLRLIAAVILGVIVGTIVFLVVAIVIGIINNSMHMAIPINLLIAENITSALLLVLFIIMGITGFVRLVLRTPPSESSDDSDE